MMVSVCWFNQISLISQFSIEFSEFNYGMLVTVTLVGDMQGEGKQSMPPKFTWGWADIGRKVEGGVQEVTRAEDAGSASFSSDYHKTTKIKLKENLWASDHTAKPNEIK